MMTAFPTWHMGGQWTTFSVAVEWRIRGVCACEVLLQDFPMNFICFRRTDACQAPTASVLYSDCQLWHHLSCLTWPRRRQKCKNCIFWEEALCALGCVTGVVCWCTSSSGDQEEPVILIWFIDFNHPSILDSGYPGLPNTAEIYLYNFKKYKSNKRGVHTDVLWYISSLMWIILFIFVDQIFLARSSFSRTSHASLFNICSSCGGLYLDVVLLGKPTHNVYQIYSVACSSALNALASQKS